MCRYYLGENGTSFALSSDVPDLLDCRGRLCVVFDWGVYATWREWEVKTGTTAVAGLRFDLALTIIIVSFWLWFAWQHGYNNSPDSWYRGALGKSIAEGHPYWINLKQGWLYEFSPWHHDAAHSPLLPAIYAIFFLIFGYVISITNIVVSLAAGLAALPLLRLSRNMTGGMLAGLVVYAWVVFSASNDFLFEVFSGLSIPVTVFLLAVALHMLWKVISRREHRHIVLCAVAMAVYFYVRPGEQLLFFGLLATSLLLGFFMLPRSAFLRLRQMWMLAFLLVLPWLIRSIVLFGSPFFSHMTPMMWTDRAYDYWSYHESIPLPTPAAYFASHSLGDLGLKIADSVKNAADILNQALDGLLLAYVALLILAGVLALGVRSRRKRFFLAMVAILGLGYALLHGLVPVIDKRYMVMPIFTSVLVTVLALASSRLRFVAVRWLTLVGVVLLLGQSQWRFWSEEFPSKIVLKHADSDQVLHQDPTIQELRRRFGPNDVFLGPIGDVQRLNFATGITFIEAPDNLDKLTNPLAFFRLYNIRYSLVDLRRILPDSQIEAMELVGDRPVFTIRLAGSDNTAAQPEQRRAPVRNRVAYVDTFHGGKITNESAFAAAGLQVVTLAGNLSAPVNRSSLLQSGLLVVRYEIGKAEFDAQELALIEQFAQGGGRILLLCPAWVAASYESKRLDALGFNRIAAKFGILIGGDYVGSPYSIGKGFGEQDAVLPFTGAPVFSRLATRANARIVLADSSGQAVAAAADLPNGARIVVWGHDNLFDDLVLAKPEGSEIAKRVLAWVMDDG